MIELEPLDVRHVRPLRELHRQPGVSAWWGAIEPMFPFDEPESTRYAIVVDGEIAGLVQHGEADWPVERHAYVDIFLGDERAIRCYEKAGFRRVGIFAGAADADTPGDDLYMELVVSDS